VLLPVLVPVLLPVLLQVLQVLPVLQVLVMPQGRVRR
jgi:hypothetical protein